MSLSAVHGALSSLKSCQADLNTGMDIVTDVAMDLSEAQDGGDHPDIQALKAVMLECAQLDREINCFVDTVQQVTAEARTQQPEAMFSLSAKVKEHFTQRVAQLSDADLSNHQKVVAFNDGIRNSSQEVNNESAETMEALGQDITVTQSQVNFTCPLTQEEMVNPVKNKKCSHHYGREAIMDLIRTKQKQKKKCRCPVIGCVNSNVVESDLVPDQMLRRKIQNQKRSNC
ncbi:E3 SUMO-protein ligase NSE2 [Gouania willdenowi]|uniref:E3 SUMO-protein ligase NSE2 n=1 Tax=Gouania willdenowi TaxID=441366 RepID=A0A8C5DML0_GOUWI|nr:E3 SUMO-protein ligase NSE2 [Gouania willdenowi]XP_028326754.1 E3 SUMO-protein ligase NSE2 [Gouania willdenowi]